MELDELKSSWDNLQQQQKQLSDNSIHQIMMTTTNTINQLQQKNKFWNDFAKVICPILIVMVLINVAISYFDPARHSGTPASITYALIMILFAVVTLYMYQRQELILNSYNPGNLKDSLAKTVKDFKRFYLIYTLTYLVLYPAYFYAVIKLLLFFFHLSQRNILITCAVLSVVCLAASHIYYKLTYFKKLKSLEADLKELMLQ
jgi:hypothetical protein